MNISNIIKNIFNFKSKYKKIDTKILPSQGIFYKNDLEIKITKASIEDTILYDHKYSTDPIERVQCIKEIVSNNIILTKNYDFFDIMAIDLIFLFFEIIKFTKNEKLLILHKNSKFEFSSKSFNYFKIPESLINYYNNCSKEFEINDFKFKLPTIGIENSLTRFLINKQISGEIENYSNLSYKFIYFLGNKKLLSDEEIENLLIIFNDDIEEENIETIDNIVENFKGFMNYSIKDDFGKVITLNDLDLTNIFK